MTWEEGQGSRQLLLFDTRKYLDLDRVGWIPGRCQPTCLGASTAPPSLSWPLYVAPVVLQGAPFGAQDAAAASWAVASANALERGQQWRTWRQLGRSARRCAVSDCRRRV